MGFRQRCNESFEGNANTNSCSAVQHAWRECKTNSITRGKCLSVYVCISPDIGNSQLLVVVCMYFAVGYDPCPMSFLSTVQPQGSVTNRVAGFTCLFAMCKHTYAVSGLVAIGNGKRSFLVST